MIYRSSFCSSVSSVAIRNRCRRPFSADGRIMEFYDSQSGKTVQYTDQLNKHMIATKPLIDQSFKTIQIGTSIAQFSAFAASFNKTDGCLAPNWVAKPTYQEEYNVNTLREFIDNHKKVVNGVVLDCSDMASFNSLNMKDLVLLAKSYDLHVRLNVSCVDVGHTDDLQRDVYDMASYIGVLADLDVNCIMAIDNSMLPSGQHMYDRCDALLQITDEVYGLDCVGLPLMQRFGYFSPFAEMQAYALEELNVKNSLIV